MRTARGSHCRPEAAPACAFGVRGIGNASRNRARNRLDGRRGLRSRAGTAERRRSDRKRRRDVHVDVHASLSMRQRRRAARLRRRRGPAQLRRRRVAMPGRHVARRGLLVLGPGLPRGGLRVHAERMVVSGSARCWAAAVPRRSARRGRNGVLVPGAELRQLHGSVSRPVQYDHVLEPPMVADRGALPAVVRVRDGVLSAVHRVLRSRRVRHRRRARHVSMSAVPAGLPRELRVLGHPSGPELHGRRRRRRHAHVLRWMTCARSRSPSC